MAILWLIAARHASTYDGQAAAGWNDCRSFHPTDVIGQAARWTGQSRRFRVKMRLILVSAGLSALAGCASVGGSSTAGGPRDATGAATTPAFLSSDIAGKAAGDLDALLGAPDLMRIEGSGEFRRYSLAECALIIILYPDEEGAKRATQIAASALKAGEPKPDLDACLAAGKPDPL
jgi:hypothetical protein